MSSKKLIACIVVALLIVGSLAACDKKEQPQTMAPAAAVEDAQQPAVEPQPVVVAQPEGEAAEPVTAAQEAAAQPEMPAADEAAAANPEAAAHN